MKNIILFILFGIGLQTAVAQTRITGKVFNKNNEPVSFATIQITNAMDSNVLATGTTGVDGTYTFNKMEPGSFILSVTMSGFNPASQLFEVGNDSLIQIAGLVLSEKTVKLEEVQITRKRKMTEILADRNVLNVQSSITASGSTLLGAIATAPNVVVDRSNNQISLNGRQGVIVMINGKQLRMSMTEIIPYLDGIPASIVKKIEFIHTPPASYDAAGNAGVISIWLLKNEEEGSNGTVTASIGYGTRPKYNLGFNYNYHKDKLNLSADFNSSNDFTQQNLNQQITSFSNHTTTNINLFSKRPVYLGLQNGRIGFDYALSPKTKISLLATGYYSNWQMNAETKTVTTVGDHYNLSQLKSTEANEWTHYMGSLEIAHQFSERSGLNFTVDYLHYRDYNPTLYENQDFDKENIPGTHNFFFSRKETPVEFLVMQLDYKLALRNNVSLEAGVKSTRSRFVNDVSVTDLVAGEWQVNPEFTSLLKLNENIQAAYLSSDIKLSPASFLKAGFRYEYSNSNLDSTANKNLVQQKYGRLFPALAFTYRFSNNSQLQFSYNERITRPSFNAMAPAFFFFGPGSILTGNTFIQATTSRQLTASYQLKKFTFTLQYSKEKNPMLFQPYVDTLQNLAVLRWDNLQYQDIGMFSVNYSITKNRWSNQSTFSFFYQRQAPEAGGITEIRKDFYVNLSSTQSFKINPTLNLELTGQMKTTRNYGFGEMPFVVNFDMALQKNIGTHHRLSLNWIDMFNLGSFIAIRYDKPLLNLNSDFHYENEGSIVKLTYAYRFGNTKLKKAENRQNASTEEMKRVN